MKFFTNIKKGRTDNQKNIISLISAFLITLVIIFIWSPFKNNKNNNFEIIEEKKLSSISPVQMIKEEFSKAFSSFKEIKEEEFLIEEIPINDILIEIVQSTSTEATTTNEIESN